MKSALSVGMAVIAAWAWLSEPAGGQRIQFVNPEPQSDADAASSAPTTGGGLPPTSSTPSPYAPPSTPPPPSTFAPESTPASAAPSSGVAPAPSARFEGNILPPPTWDPYAPPGSQPQTLLPQDPYLPGGVPAVAGPPGGMWARMMRFRQEVRLEYSWIPGDGPEEFGINDFDLHGTFAIPFLYNTETPILVTPGIGYHMWNGPISPAADMPDQAFDGYLDSAWNPQLTPILGGELGFTIGVHSDFSRVVSESIRYRGRGLITLAFSPSFTVKAGVLYLDRVRIKILPAGGIVWVPDGNPDVRFEILFPNPRIALRLATDAQNTEWWVYARGEYGGGSWTVKRAVDLNGDTLLNDIDEVDYNDLRFAVGFQFDSYSGLDGQVEIGLAFDRELFYRSGTPTFRPNPSVFLGGQLAF